MVHGGVGPGFRLQGLGQRQPGALPKAADAVADGVEQHVDLSALLQTEHPQLEGPQRLLPADWQQCQMLFSFC